MPLNKTLVEAILLACMDPAPINLSRVVPGVVAGLMRDINANPLDIVETEAITRRRRELSEMLDSANLDLSAFHRRQGKMIVRPQGSS